MKLKRKNRPEHEKRSRQRKTKPHRRGPAYWMAVGSMGAMMSFAPGLSSPNIALALNRDIYAAVAADFISRQTQQPALKFDIAPGPLESVLASFERVSGFHVQVPQDAIRGIQSPGVTGDFSPEEALKRLLAGTGVSYRFTLPGTAALEVTGPSDSVTIVGGPATISSPKYTEPLRDIPQTVAIISKEVIEQQGATTLRDVLRNVPGLTLTAGEGGNPAGDNLTLRGFSARNDIFVDGVRDLSPQARDPFNLEQVEVTKGPGSAYTGRGSTGGTINLVSKSPALDPSYGFTLNFGSDRTRRFTGDLNLPLERLGLGKRAAFRLNVLAHDSHFAGRDDVENQRWGVAPSLAFGLGTRTRLTLSYFKLQQDNISDYGIPWVPATNNVLKEFRDKPAPVPRDTFYGLLTRDFEHLNSDLATVRFERDFNDNASLRNQFRYGRSTRDSIATPPRFASDNSTDINREMRSWLTEDEIWDNQTDFKAAFSTGSIRHSLVTGLDLMRERNTRGTRTAPNMLTTLLNPNPHDVYPFPITTSPIVGDVTGDSIAAYAFDTLRFGSKFEVNGGLRWDYFDVAGTTIQGLPVARIDRMLSGRAGVVFKPRANGSIYAAYGSSLNPSLEGLSYNVANAAIDPEKTYNFEVGSKWDLLKERLSLSLAGFRVTKTNARTPGLAPGDPPQVLEGRQRVYGTELGASGTLTRDWSIFAAYTYLDSEILESNTPAEVGREIQNTPKHSFSIWSTYQLPWKLNFGGGARFVDSRFGNNTNTRQVDSYWTIDALASYPINKHLELRLNLYNLNDAYYFDRLGGGHIIPGPSRSVSGSIGINF